MENTMGKKKPVLGAGPGPGVGLLREGSPRGPTLTLDDDKGRGVDAADAVGREARVLPTVLLSHVLNVKAARGSDANTRVDRHRGLVPSRPGDLGQGVAGGAALQGDTLPDQHLCVLRLDYKSGSSCDNETQVRSYFL